MELKVTLEGGKRVSTQVGDHLIVTDQPVKSGGGDSAPAPYDLFVASIATCAGFYVQSYCDSKGIDSSGINIRLNAERDPKSNKITGFTTTISLPPELPEKLYPVLEKVAAQCAVKKTISSDPSFSVRCVRAE